MASFFQIVLHPRQFVRQKDPEGSSGWLRFPFWPQVRMSVPRKPASFRKDRNANGSFRNLAGNEIP